MKKEKVEYASRIKVKYSSLSKKQREIADFIVRHQKEIKNYSISMLAKKTNTVPSTITRFCQALSFKGFSELKVYVEKELILSSIKDNHIDEDDSISIIAQKLMNQSSNAIVDTLRLINEKTFVEACRRIKNSKRVFLFGQSGGYVSAMYAKQMFLRLGIFCNCYDDSLEMNIASSVTDENDIVIGFGYSGENKVIVSALENVVKNGTTVISITADPNSTVAKLSEFRLFYSYNIPDDISFLHIASICEIAILGLMQAEILHQMGQTDEILKIRNRILGSRLK